MTTSTEERTESRQPDDPSQILRAIAAITLEFLSDADCRRVFDRRMAEEARRG